MFLDLIPSLLHLLVLLIGLLLAALLLLRAILAHLLVLLDPAGHLAVLVRDLVVLGSERVPYLVLQLVDVFVGLLVLGLEVLELPDQLVGRADLGALELLVFQVLEDVLVLLDLFLLLLELGLAHDRVLVRLPWAALHVFQTLVVELGLGVCALLCPSR